MMTVNTPHEGVDTLSIIKPLPFPIDWDHFGLSVFLGQQERATVTTFANLRTYVQPILDVDAALIEKAPIIFHQPLMHEQAGSMLFMRMFSVLRAAARLVFAGQQYEARAVLRSALECGVYGWALTTDTSLLDLWQRRDVDEKTRQTARNKLSWGLLNTALIKQSPQIGNMVAGIYDKLIDLGAHPNPGGIVEGMFEIVDAEGGKMLMTKYGGGTPESIAVGLAELLRVMHSGFKLLRLAMPERLTKDGIDQSVEAIFAASGYN